MTAVAVSQWTPLRLQPQFLTRNGQVVNVQIQSSLAQLANQLRRWRVKELFRRSGTVGRNAVGASQIQPSGGTRSRWRFAGHTSPQTSLAYAKVLVAMPTVAASDAYVQLDITTPGGVTIASGQFHYANAASSVTDTPDTFGEGTIWLTTMLGNQDFYAVFSDHNNARLLAATVYETGPYPDTVNGYIGQTFSVGGNIYDTHRSDVAQLGVNLWRYGAPPVFHWGVDLDASPITNATATHLNVIDGTSTAPSANTPGYTLDMRYKNTIAQASGVPCVIAAYGNRSAGATANQQFVEIVDHTGTVVVSLTGFADTTPGWVTAAFNLPASLAKYDVRFYSGNGTLSLMDVSVYEYE